MTVVDQRVTFINRAGEQLLGAGSAQDALRSLSDLPQAAIIAELQNMAAPDGYHTTLTWPRFDGTPVKLEVFAKPFTLNEQRAVQIIGRDRTQIEETARQLAESQSHHRRLMELYLDLIGVEAARTAERAAALRQARQVDELKSQLLSTVSHELRTPLTAIRGQTSTLLDYADEIGPAELREALRIVDEQAARLDELISHILDMSRIESGTLHVEPIATDVGPILEETVAQLGSQASHHQLEVQAPAHLPLVQADPRRVRQILGNLLDNAIKFSPAGTTITVNAAHDAKTLRVSVSDQGPGIAPEHLPHLFDRFYRIEGNGRRAGGVGLGLAICKGLVEAMGGQVSVSSRVGQGSTFGFSLRLVPTDGAQPVYLPH
jgi:signal transduction histidine kinase